MFTINHISNINPHLNHMHIYNDNISCKICPNLGGSLQEFIVNNIEIIDGIILSEDGLASYIETFNSALMFPFVGRIPNGTYTYKDVLYSLEVNEVDRHNAIHGLIYNKTFKIDEFHTTRSSAKIQLSYISDGLLAGFPFKFNCQILYLISNEGLRIEFKVMNTGESSFPFGMGWHPYFKSDDLGSSLIYFSSNEKLKYDENLIPIASIKTADTTTFEINNQRFDDTFILLKNEVKFKTKNYQIEMNFNSINKGCVQIYTPKHRESIALEPLTFGPNAFNTNNGLLELKPNESYNWIIDLKMKTNV
ncbi:MAG: aldose 1-epimerase [Flavobacteriaceae bacterium]|nr:aldose 1-epimerase [Flavobacteriaceae bacterium]